MNNSRIHLLGDTTIPANSTIIISMFKVHRNKEYWGEDVEEYKPERFEPENFKKVPHYAYVPFTGKKTFRRDPIT